MLKWRRSGGGGGGDRGTSFSVFEGGSSGGDESLVAETRERGVRSRREEGLRLKPCSEDLTSTPRNETADGVI